MFIGYVWRCMGSEHEAENKRRRGIQASPAKIRAALVASGLKTQAALAEKIADLEGLESPPKGLVNRVWRGEAVDPQSLERVARALGVPAWGLYRSSDEPADPRVDAAESGEPSPVAPSPTPQPVRARRSFWWLAPVLAVGTGALWWLGNRAPAPKAPLVDEANGRLGAVLLPIDAPNGEAVAQAFGAAIDRYWRLLPLAPARPGKAPDPQELLLLGGIDRVIEGRVLQDGRWLGLVVYVHERGAMREAWSGAWRRSMAPQQAAALWNEAAAAITQPQTVAGSRTRAGLEKFLSARRFVDAANTELNNRRALSDFESALRLAPNFVEARAGLCEALVLDNVRTGDATRLTEAARECNAVLRTAPENPEVRRAEAYLNRKRGKLDEALTGFEAVLKETPDHVDALLGLAEVQMTRYARGEDPKALESAEAAARRAQIVEPEFWKAPFTLARVLYSGEKLEPAIAAAEASVTRNANLLTLSNLGTFQFCKGDFAAARSAYERARQLEPTAFVGDAQLAVVLYFQREFAAAAGLFKRGLDLQAQSGKPEEHRLWGNYADALRQSGDAPGAEAAYARAIALAERDLAGGDGNPVHGTYLAFYYEMLANIAPERWRGKRVSDSALTKLRTTNDPLALLHLAAAYQHRGNRVAAEQIKQQAGSGCPGFLQSPDL